MVSSNEIFGLRNATSTDGKDRLNVTDQKSVRTITSTDDIQPRRVIGPNTSSLNTQASGDKNVVSTPRIVRVYQVSSKNINI